MTISTSATTEVATSASTPSEMTTDSFEPTSNSAPVEMTTSSSAPAVPVAAIAGGVVSGVLFLFILVILILVLALLVFRQGRTKTFDVQGTNSKLSYGAYILVRHCFGGFYVI